MGRPWHAMHYYLQLLIGHFRVASSLRFKAIWYWYENAVKPVYNGHPWETAMWPLHTGWPLCTGQLCRKYRAINIWEVVRLTVIYWVTAIYRAVIYRFDCFYSHANKTHFHNKGSALGLVLKVRVFEAREWPISFVLLRFRSVVLATVVGRFVASYVWAGDRPHHRLCKMFSFFFIAVGFRGELCPKASHYFWNYLLWR